MVDQRQTSVRHGNGAYLPKRRHTGDTEGVPHLPCAQRIGSIYAIVYLLFTEQTHGLCLQTLAPFVKPTDDIAPQLDAAAMVRLSYITRKPIL